MTKRKTGVFQGGWLNSIITNPTARPPLTENQAQAESNKEAKEREALTIELATWRVKRGEFKRINEAEKHPTTIAIIKEVLRQLSLWRFEQQRKQVEPEPAAWRGLIEAIAIPEEPTPMDTLSIKREVQRLPGHVRAVLDAALLRRSGGGYLGLFQRLIDTPTRADAQLLKDTLKEMSESLESVTGKRGNEIKKGPFLVAVRKAIEQHTASMRTPKGVHGPREMAAILLKEAGVNIPPSRSALAELDKE